MWENHFSSHTLHGSMLKALSCGCESMHSYLFSPQESLLCNEKQNANQAIARLIQRVNVRQ
jgi:hypothetical protein